MEEQELIGYIMANGVKAVIQDEPVLDGLTRPLVVHYTADEGIVEETTVYATNPDGSSTAMNRWWGAIQSISQVYLLNPEVKIIEL
jgi:hypothetical protein